MTSFCRYFNSMKATKLIDFKIVTMWYKKPFQEFDELLTAKLNQSKNSLQISSISIDLLSVMRLIDKFYFIYYLQDSKDKSL